jgi:hypothetical protein
MDSATFSTLRASKISKLVRNIRSLGENSFLKLDGFSPHLMFGLEQMDSLQNDFVQAA